MFKHYHSLSFLLSLGFVSCAVPTTPDDFAGLGQGMNPSVPVVPVLDLHGLAREAVDWIAAIIGQIDKSGADGTAKLNSASQAFGETLADNIDALESKVQVLDKILNSDPINAVEHTVIREAVELGGTALAGLLKTAVQTVFNGLRSIGHI